MNDVVLIVATTASAGAALLSLISVYLHNRPIVVASLEQNGQLYRLVVTNLSTTASARNMLVSVRRMPSNYSDIWTHLGIEPRSTWRIHFIAPGETLGLTGVKVKVADAWLKEVMSQSFSKAYRSEVVIDIRPAGQFTRYNPLSKTTNPLSFKYPRVEDVRLSMSTQESYKRRQGERAEHDTRQQNLKDDVTPIEGTEQRPPPG